MSGNKDKLPQEGTGYAGESLSVSMDTGCPAYSGGGTFHSQGNCPDPTTTRNHKDTDNAIRLTTTGEVGILSDGISEDDALYTTAQKARAGRCARRSKRPHEGPEEVPEPEKAPKVTTSRRGRRAGTSGVTLSYVKAKSRLRELELRSLDTVTDEETSGKDDLIRSAQQGVGTIQREASKSGNLKGTVWREINKASDQILKALESLQTSSADEETRRLMADNKRMKEELAALRAEMKALRTAFTNRAKSPSPTTEPPADALLVPQGLENLVEDLKRHLIVSLGEMINARLGEMEKRLPPEPVLRPSLAADRRNGAAINSHPGPSAEPSRAQRLPAKTHPAAATAAAKPAAAGATGPTARRRRRRAAAQSAAQSHVAKQTATPDPTTEWTEVVRRKPKKKSTTARPHTAVAPRASTKAAPRKKKIATPKSTAVVITLKPEAIQQKMSYKDAIGRATSSLELGTVGLDSVRLRNTATGARIIEVPGANSSDKADALAEKLKDLIGDVAVITRPIKNAGLLITGLDESIDPESVQRAVATNGGCTLEQVKVGGIRTRPNGTGSVLVQCPVVAAQNLNSAGRLLVGWSSAQVRTLDPLPLRCFRCMGIGHTRALCPSPVDRTNLCFRCGKEGHNSATCTAEPSCAVCTHARRPADHVMGRRACNPPPTKGKVVSQTWTGKTTEGQMET